MWNHNHEQLPNEVLRHVYWMRQKYDLGQDMCLCGHPGSLKRQIALAFARIHQLDIEYLQITRDTTENDLKQRREIYGSNVIFHDQPPVRAAIHGKLLILDGIENAERNVLPALNNLLENREMSLDDGRLLTNSKPAGHINSSNNSNNNDAADANIVFVHPNFRVIALSTSSPPYDGRSFDPPLRSRFQSRFIDELSSDSLLQLLTLTETLTPSLTPSLENSSVSTNTTRVNVNNEILNSLLILYESIRNFRMVKISQGSSSNANMNTTKALNTIPIFSSEHLSYILQAKSRFPSVPISSFLSTCLPTMSWLSHYLSSDIQSTMRLYYNKMKDTDKTPPPAPSNSSYMNSVWNQLKPANTVTSSDDNIFAIKNCEFIDNFQKVEIMITNTSNNNNNNNNNNMKIETCQVDVGSAHLHTSSSSSSKNLNTNYDEYEILPSLLPSQKQVFINMLLAHSFRKHLCILGPKVRIECFYLL